MTMPTAREATFPRSRLILLGGVALASGVALYAASRVAHSPDWPLLFSQDAVILIHFAAALFALMVGVVQLVGVKGTQTHKVVGWSWVIAMMIVAGSSFFIHESNPPSGWSWIHLLSGWTAIIVPMGVVAIRRGKVGSHARAMTLTFLGGLIVAGLFTLAPGRLLWRVFFG